VSVPIGHLDHTQRRAGQLRVLTAVRDSGSRYTRAVSRRIQLFDARWLALALVVLPGCEGELAALFSLAFGTALGAWMVSRDRQNRALYAA
jgi:hypothetical protein